jgi:hypothetical protein
VNHSHERQRSGWRRRPSCQRLILRKSPIHLTVRHGNSSEQIVSIQLRRIRRDDVAQRLLGFRLLTTRQCNTRREDLQSRIVGRLLLSCGHTRPRRSDVPLCNIDGDEPDERVVRVRRKASRVFKRLPR